MTLPMRISRSRTSSATTASLDAAASSRNAATILRLIRIAIDLAQCRGLTDPAGTAGPNTCPAPDLRRPTRQHFDQPVKIFLAPVERGDGNPLVLAMGTEIVDVVGQARMAVGGDAGVTQIAAVGGTRTHDGNDERTRPELRRQLLDRSENFLVQRR